MRCPFCASTETEVKDSRLADSGLAIRRRRACKACKGRFTTYERVQLRDLEVIKSSGKREAFDRDKLERSIRIALRKRPVSPEGIVQVITGIVNRIESSAGSDLYSSQIGKVVMEALARIDPVAYVRFASVYKNFQSAEDFENFLQELGPPKNLSKEA